MITTLSVASVVTHLLLCSLNHGISADSESNEVTDTDLSPRIIGGRDARIGEFPWMVALYYGDRFSCSAFIVSPNIVMTAAHCVIFNLDEGIQPAPFFYGIAGNINREGPDTRIEFIDVVAHPGYDGGANNDIALFYSRERIRLDENIQKVCLPEPNRIFENIKAQAMGWGVMKRGSNEPAQILQTAEVLVTTLEYCQVVYRLTGAEVTEGHVCAGILHRGICFGDSGGPLVLLNGQKSIAIGIASYVSRLGCAPLSIPGVYAATSYFYDWIIETVGDRDTSEICFE